MSKRQETKEWILRYFDQNGTWASGSKAASANGYDLRDTYRISSSLKKKAAGVKDGEKVEAQIDDTIQKRQDGST